MFEIEKPLAGIVGENIKRLRKSKGMSQIALEVKAGIGKRSVSVWETGKKVPSTHTLWQLSKVLECSIDDLFREGR